MLSKDQLVKLFISFVIKVKPPGCRAVNWILEVISLILCMIRFMMNLSLFYCSVFKTTPINIKIKVCLMKQNLV